MRLENEEEHSEVKDLEKGELQLRICQQETPNSQEMPEICEEDKNDSFRHPEDVIEKERPLRKESHTLNDVSANSAIEDNSKEIAKTEASYVYQPKFLMDFIRVCYL